MSATPLRREPPMFRRVRVREVMPRTPRLTRITLDGPELEGLDPGLPASSVRVLLPPTDGSELVVPEWNGNEFLFADGRRPPIRTLTPLRLDPSGPTLDIEVVRHGDGPLSQWAERARPGDDAAVSGTGRGYEPDPAATSYLVAGDESALPAITTLLPALPGAAKVQVLVELGGPDGRIELPEHPGATVTWCELPAGATPGDALVEAVRATSIDLDARIWAAGEAAAVQRIRRHLFEDLGVPRERTVVRGYWKLGRLGAGTDA